MVTSVDGTDEGCCKLTYRNIAFWKKKIQKKLIAPGNHHYHSFFFLCMHNISHLSLCCSVMSYRAGKQRLLWSVLSPCCYLGNTTVHSVPAGVIIKGHINKSPMPSCWVPFCLIESLLPAFVCALKLQLKMTGVLPLPVSLSLCMCEHTVLQTNMLED